MYEKLSPSVWTVVVTNTSGKSTGSAVVIGAGQLITNCHVLSGGRSITVAHDNVSYGARLMSPDAERDLCILSVENFHAPAVEISQSASVKVGQRVYTIGSPLGRQNTLSDGLISQLVRDATGVVRSIGISAPISHGSSGGGLFDAHGVLVGITSSGVDPSKGENLNDAIPAEWIRDVPARAESQLARRRAEQSVQQTNQPQEPQTAGSPQPPQPRQEPNAPAAADFVKATNSGSPVLVSSHGAWAQRTCQARFVPKITVMQSPVHGRLDINEGAIAISSANSGQCTGQTITGVLVVYVPDSNFKGRDTFSYVSSGNPSVTKTAVVDVR